MIALYDPQGNIALTSTPKVLTFAQEAMLPYTVAPAPLSLGNISVLQFSMTAKVAYSSPVSFTIKTPSVIQKGTLACTSNTTPDPTCTLTSTGSHHSYKDTITVSMPPTVNFAKAVTVPISISGITLPVCDAVLSFEVQVMSSNFFVEKGTATHGPNILQPGNLTMSSVVSSSSSTGQPSDLQISFNHPYRLKQLSDIEILLPTTMTLQPGSLCSLTGLEPGAICTKVSTNALRVTSGMAGADRVSGGPFISVAVTGVKNPTSLGSFPIQVNILSAEGCKYFTGASNLVIDTLPLLSIASFQPARSLKNIFETYTFRFTPSLPVIINSGDFLEVEFPPDMMVSDSPQCTPKSPNLLSSACSKPSSRLLRIDFTHSVALFASNQEFVIEVKYCLNPSADLPFAGLNFSLKDPLGNAYQERRGILHSFAGTALISASTAAFDSAFKGKEDSATFSLRLDAFLHRGSVIVIRLSQHFELLSDPSLLSSSVSMRIDSVDRANNLVKVYLDAPVEPNSTFSFKLALRNPVTASMPKDSVTVTVDNPLSKAVASANPFTSDQIFECHSNCVGCGKTYTQCLACKDGYFLQSDSSCSLSPTSKAARSIAFIFLGMAVLLILFMLVFGLMCRRRNFNFNCLYALLRVNTTIGLIFLFILSLLSTLPGYYIGVFAAVLALHFISSILAARLLTYKASTLDDQSSSMVTAPSSDKRQSLLRLLHRCSYFFSAGLLRYFYSNKQGFKGLFWEHPLAVFDRLKRLLHLLGLLYTALVLAPIAVLSLVYYLTAEPILFMLEIPLLALLDAIVLALAVIELHKSGVYHSDFSAFFDSKATKTEVENMLTPSNRLEDNSKTEDKSGLLDKTLAKKVPTVGEVLQSLQSLKRGEDGQLRDTNNRVVSEEEHKLMNDIAQLDRQTKGIVRGKDGVLRDKDNQIVSEEQYKALLSRQKSLLSSARLEVLVVEDLEEGRQGKGDHPHTAKKVFPESGDKRKAELQKLNSEYMGIARGKDGLLRNTENQVISEERYQKLKEDHDRWVESTIKKSREGGWRDLESGVNSEGEYPKHLQKSQARKNFDIDLPQGSDDSNILYTDKSTDQQAGRLPKPLPGTHQPPWKSVSGQAHNPSILDRSENGLKRGKEHEERPGDRLSKQIADSSQPGLNNGELIGNIVDPSDPQTKNTMQQLDGAERSKFEGFSDLGPMGRDTEYSDPRLQLLNLNPEDRDELLGLERQERLRKIPPLTSIDRRVRELPTNYQYSPADKMFKAVNPNPIKPGNVFRQDKEKDIIIEKSTTNSKPLNGRPFNDNSKEVEFGSEKIDLEAGCQLKSAVPSRFLENMIMDKWLFSCSKNYLEIIYEEGEDTISPRLKENTLYDHPDLEQDLRRSKLILGSSQEVDKLRNSNVAEAVLSNLPLDTKKKLISELIDRHSRGEMDSRELAEEVNKMKKGNVGMYRKLLKGNDNVVVDKDGDLKEINGQAIDNINKGIISDRHNNKLRLGEQKVELLQFGVLEDEDGHRIHLNTQAPEDLRKGLIRDVEGRQYRLADQSFQDLQKGIFYHPDGTVAHINGQRPEDINQGILVDGTGKRLKAIKQTRKDLEKGILKTEDGLVLRVPPGQVMADIQAGLFKGPDGQKYRIKDQQFEKINSELIYRNKDLELVNPDGSYLIPNDPRIVKDDGFYSDNLANHAVYNPENPMHAYREEQRVALGKDPAKQGVNGAHVMPMSKMEAAMQFYQDINGFTKDVILQNQEDLENSLLNRDLNNSGSLDRSRGGLEYRKLGKYDDGGSKHTILKSVTQGSADRPSGGKYPLKMKIDPETLIVNLIAENDESFDLALNIEEASEGQSERVSVRMEDMRERGPLQGSKVLINDYHSGLDSNTPRSRLARVGVNKLQGVHPVQQTEQVQSVRARGGLNVLQGRPKQDGIMSHGNKSPPTGPAREGVKRPPTSNSKDS